MATASAAVSRHAISDVALSVLAVALAAGMAASVVVPALGVQLAAPGLDLVLATIRTLVAFSVAALGWVRYRQSGGPIALFLTAAFLVLAIANGLSVALVVSGFDTRNGIVAPGQTHLRVLAIARSIAVVLLIIGGIASLRDRRVSRPLSVVVGAVISMIILIAVVERTGSLSAFGVAGTLDPLPDPAALVASVEILVAALFFLAAWLASRLYRRDASIGLAFLSAGLVLGGFARVLTAIHPSAYPGLVTAGDVLWLAFGITLMIGMLAEEGVTWARLRTANSDLERLRTLDVERAALQERAHLSRELHDGLAQNLWLAKLKAGRLSALPDLGQEASTLVRELEGAIDAGLAEAQQAVTALRVSGETTGPLWDVIASYVDDFADRFGLRAEVECPTGRSGFAPRVEAELLRIAQEALSNVVRHADATVVRVRAAVENGCLELLVSDNGRGFDPAAVGERAYGLASMRERTKLIGGELRIDSHPRDGTRVRVLVPVPQVAPTPGGTLW